MLENRNVISKDTAKLNLKWFQPSCVYENEYFFLTGKLNLLPSSQPKKINIIF